MTPEEMFGAPDEGDGLDLSLLGGGAQGAPPAQMPPSMQQATGQNRWKQLAPLMALLPIAAAKGGRVGVAALLNGMQQAQQRAQAEGYRAEQMGMQRQQMDAQAQARAQAAQQASDRQRQMMAKELLSDLSDSLRQVETEEQAQKLIETMMPVIEQAGIPRGRIEAMRLTYASSSRTQQRRAKKALDAVLATTPREDLGGVRVSFDGQALGVDELAAIANGATGATITRTPKAPEEPDMSKSGLDVQLAHWRRQAAAGNPQAAAQVEILEKTIKDADAMRRDPPRVTVDMGGLNPRLQSFIDSLSKGFDAQPVVKKIQTMAEAVSFADGLNPNTTNPADDQALIYAFAKAMDPDSVVREGEYATVQKYGQSWAEQFGFDVKRLFSNTAFLTPQARANMKATVRAKYAAALPQYQNVRKSYVDRINKRTGTKDGDQYLIDYGAAFPDAGGAGRSAAPLSYEDYKNRKAGGR